MLPTGVLPVTAVPTVIRFAPRAEARVETAAGGWRDVPLSELIDYVSEERNPAQDKRSEPQHFVGGGHPVTPEMYRKLMGRKY